VVAIKSSQRADQRRQLVAAASVPVSRFDMSPSDKSAVFFFRHPVGVTGGPLDAFAVKHCDFISASVDQLLRLRFCSASVTPGRLPQASKPRILSERKEIVADAVVGHQIQRANRWSMRARALAMAVCPVCTMNVWTNLRSRMRSGPLACMALRSSAAAIHCRFRQPGYKWSAATGPRRARPRSRSGPPCR
jgi:hypothetical protein